MTAVEETAYPRLKRHYQPDELARIYTPTAPQQALAQAETKGPVARVGFLVLLKTFQRLGYFVPVADVPTTIIQHIAQTLNLPIGPVDLTRYDASGTRKRHITIIRTTLQVQPFGHLAMQVLVRAIHAAAATKVMIADLINVALAELVRQHYELPVFATLDRAAHHVRALVHRGYYRQVTTHLGTAGQAALDALLVIDPATQQTGWALLKQEPASPTLHHLMALLDRQAALDRLPAVEAALAGIPVSKRTHFATEAATLDAARMASIEPHKRATLIAAFIASQQAQARDDLAEMAIKRVLAIHQRAKDALVEYQAQHQHRTDALVLTLRDTVVAYQLDGSTQERLAALDTVLGTRSTSVLTDCEAYLAHTGTNYYPFVWAAYRSHRATLFRILKALRFQSTTQNTALLDALAFALAHERSTGDWLPTVDEVQEGRYLRHYPRIDLTWVPESWWRLLTDQWTRSPYPRRVKRRHFEACLFSQLVWDLKSGDLAIVGSGAFADYREQLISLAEYGAQVAAYGYMVNLPVEGTPFIALLQANLDAQARATDASFPKNDAVRIEAGEPIVRRQVRAPEPVSLAALEATIAERLEPVSILEILHDTAQWLQWPQYFAPISGHDAKIEEPLWRYLATTFCYGCNLGPMQTARSITGLERRQLAWIDQRHITIDGLDLAIRDVTNAYHRFTLPFQWGTGAHVSADGTKWDLYEQNLLAEYHIRYGGYGGIGYYHVADTYIALFSQFIPCGVWEAVYILDGLLKQQSDLQPTMLHGDTQAQSAPVFALAFLLVIKLMPRIRNWKRLTLVRPSRTTQYTHIDALFGRPVDWEIIATHLPDMLRVVLSIKAGRLSPSTILRRLSTYSAHNKLYQAFCELGRVIRTEFLLLYLADEALRTTIHAATNKSESFNRFVQWVGFGGEGTIADNHRQAQRKAIKYNHLVANCVVFYNVFALSQVLHDLQHADQAIDPAAIAALSPYITHYINRFGRYHLDPNRQPPPLQYDMLAPFDQHSWQSPPVRPERAFPQDDSGQLMFDGF